MAVYRKTNNRKNKNRYKKYAKFIVAALVFTGNFVLLYVKSLPQLVVYNEFNPDRMDIRKTTVVTGKIEPRNEVAAKPMCML